MTITHQITNKQADVSAGGDIGSQLSGLIGQATALMSAGAGLPGIQAIGAQIAGMGSSITGAGGAAGSATDTSGISTAITGLGTALSSITSTAGATSLLSSLTGQLGSLTSLLDPNSQMAQVIHSHILDAQNGISHSAFQGQHTVKLTQSGIGLNSSQNVTTTAPKIPHNGQTLVSDNLMVTKVITGQAFGMLSDVRLKNNINDLGPVLDKVLALKVKTFNIKAIDFEREEMLPFDTPSVGLIAQEVMQQFPQLVRNGRYLSIDIDKLVMILLAAFIELASEIRQ
jgi:hypothetical protein